MEIGEMTQLLSDLLYNFGLLHITLHSLEEARAQWSQNFGCVMSQEKLDETPVAADQPVLVVVAKSETEEPDFLHPSEHSFVAIDAEGTHHTDNVSVLELPFDEYHFFSAFRPGIHALTEQLPTFLFGMVVTHAYGLFENYFLSLLRPIIVSRPEMLGTSKQVSYGDVLECRNSMNTLITRLAERYVRDLSYKSFRDQLKSLRTRLGFRDLTDEFDDDLIELALVSNCLVHNRGVPDQGIAEEFPSTYIAEKRMSVNKELVDKTILICRRFAVALDEKARAVYSIS